MKGFKSCGEGGWGETWATLSGMSFLGRSLSSYREAAVWWGDMR